MKIKKIKKAVIILSTATLDKTVIRCNYHGNSNLLLYFSL